MHATLPTDGLSSQALAEMLDFPLRLLARLPIAVRIDVEVPGLPRKVVLTTEPTVRSGDELEFSGRELQALALGVEAGRLWPGDLKGFCLAKLHDPEFVVTDDEALAGAFAASTRPATLGEVVVQLDLRVISASLVADRERDIETPDAVSTSVQAA